MSRPFREALVDLYRAVADEIAAEAPVCDLSGRCCRFEDYGHTLFLSRPEAELLAEPGLPPGAVVSPAGCPYQVGGLCTARERRPLGCRIYYCDPRYATRMEEISESAIRRLKALHDEHGIPWDYRPLHAHLEAVRNPGRSDASRPPPEDQPYG